MTILGFLILLQYMLTRNFDLATANDDRPRRRSAKDHTLRPVSEKYKKGLMSAIHLPIWKAKAKLDLQAYTFKLGHANVLDFMSEYFSFQCSIYNRKIPLSFQHVNARHSQRLVDSMVKRLSANKKTFGKEISSIWLDKCLEYEEKVITLSRTHAKEWNTLINTRLLNIRIYSNAKGYDLRNQLLIDAVIKKDTLNFKNEIIKLSRKQQKEIYCLSPPEVSTDYDIAFKPLYNHLNGILLKLFGNTQYHMAKYLVEVSNQVLTMVTAPHLTSGNTKFMLDESISAKFSLLDKCLHEIWVDIPNSALPSHHLSTSLQIFLEMLKFIWNWLYDFLKRCLDNENEEKKKLIFDDVVFNI